MQSENSAAPSASRHSTGFFSFLLCIGIVLVILYHKSFDPDQTLFANDGPLGLLKSEQTAMPSGFFGNWKDLNFLGEASPIPAPGFTSYLLTICSPVLFLKVYNPLSLFLLGLSAWLFF